MRAKLLYICTIFLSAFLLFQVQPIIAKILLPRFGGAASVWITCMLFFQTALLGGYVYAHWLIGIKKHSRQVYIHVLLLVVSVFALPVAPKQMNIMVDIDPVLHLLYLLCVSVGFPYILLSTTSPLLQSWYSSAFSHAMPYRLFALSNLASLVGLLAYPIVFEPNMTLSQQSGWWSGAYVAFAAICISTALHSAKSTADECPPETGAICPQGGTPAPTPREKTLWMALAACASVLLLATTNYLTQDIASIPFLWILPLCLYLLTFTLCFERSGWYSRNLYLWIMLAVLGTLAYALVEPSAFSMAVKIPLFCAGLFVSCMFCHGELAAHKPDPEHLTSFYLMISLGGALGGVLVGILAPKFLPGPFEFVIALSACALLLFLVNFRTSRLNAAVSGAVTVSILIASAYYVYDFAERALLLTRNFYSCLKVMEYNSGSEDGYRTLVHGAITHGIQYTDANKRAEPLSYYSPRSGIGLIIKNLAEGPRRIGVVGLGIGSLLGYARPNDHYSFYEINPQVDDVARKEFFFITGCKGKVDVLIGDGRLLLERENKQNYDLLVIDAFSGDSIPVHLLTVEAVELYFRHLKPGGILALHISNTHLDLAPVVEQIRASLGKKAVLISDDGDDDGEIYNSDWVLMTTDRDLLKIPDIKKVGEDLKSDPRIRPWTDNYSNLAQILVLPDIFRNEESDQD